MKLVFCLDREILTTTSVMFVNILYTFSTRHIKEHDFVYHKHVLL